MSKYATELYLSAKEAYTCFHRHHRKHYTVTLSHRKTVALQYSLKYHTVKAHSHLVIGNNRCANTRYTVVQVVQLYVQIRT
jgi:hypothetical protein